MISEMAGPGAAQHAFVIQPNPPIPWSFLLRVFAAMAAFVESGHARPARRESLRRPWTRVILERDRDSWYPGRLPGEQERSDLARRLRRALDAVVVERRINSISSIGAESCRGLEHEA